MKNLIYLLFAFTLLFVNCKKDEETLPSKDTPGQLHPEYLGKWITDSTYENGILNKHVDQYVFEFQDSKCIETSLNNLSENNEFDLWEINTNILKYYDTKGIFYPNPIESFTIILPPTNNKMILKKSETIWYITKK